MKYKIDVVRIRENSITLNGWVVGKNPEARAEFFVEDAQHRPIAFQYVSTRRDDVSQIYYKKIYDRDFGFDIRFPYERGKDYYLIIRCEGRKARIKYNEQLIEKRASVAYKRMQKIRDLMNMETVHVAMDFWKENGLRALILKSKHKIQGLDNDYDYGEWYELTKPSEEELERLRKVFNKPGIQVNQGYLNNLDLRFYNEPARHKLLDILGDFALLGIRLKGRVLATRPGHFANTEMIKLLRKNIRRAGTKPQYAYNPNETPKYDINQIRQKLPHRPPFLLVDKIIHIDDNSVAGIKNVTMNEPFFVGHFPDEPVMPGVLIVEAMAQCGGILALHNMDPNQSYSTYFMKIDAVRFKNKVVPGDTLQFELHLTEPIRRGIVVMEAKAFVGEKLVTEAMLMAQVTPNKK